MNQEKFAKDTDKKSQYRYGSVLFVIALAVIPALVVGTLSYLRALKDGYADYNQQMIRIVEGIDAHADDLLQNIKSLNKALAASEDVVKANGKITSYVNLKPEAGESTVRMIPGRAGADEKKLYDIMQKFVEAFPSIIYITLATRATEES
ncbi:hypothetical protein V1L52_11985 [Treponema sp. HNW]|uniref:hypothetical protein n=1 Tax=Treponema sp. HNW TaxID=3116654 RepID=UPI003D0D7AE9